MFRACELVLVNKIDLLAAPRLRPRPASCTTSTRCTRACERMLVSARTGEGVEAWRDWLPRVPGARGGARVTRRRCADARDDALAGRSSARADATRTASVLRGRGRPDRAAVPPDGRALRARRAADRARRVAAPARSDVRHVAVEFVHPVIVGKRALPALGLSAEGGPLAAQVAAGRRARRHRDRVRRRPDVTAALALHAPRLPDDRLRATSAPSGSSRRRATTRSSRQELVETLYHVLWELVHVFFEHRGLLEGRAAARCTTRARRASSIRSSPSARTTSRRSSPTCARRSLMKAAEVGALRAQTLGEGRETLLAPRRPSCARRSRAAGELLALGNGGSATDAMDAVADFRTPPPQRLAGAARARPHRGRGDPHRARQRHRRRGDVLRARSSPTAARATRCSRSRRAAARRT